MHWKALALLLLCCACAGCALVGRPSRDTVRLVSGDLSACICTRTGDIVSLTHRGNELLAAPATLAVSVMDAEGKNPTPLPPCPVAEFTHDPAGQSVRLVRQWGHARTAVTIRLSGDGLEWSVAATGPAPTREAVVEHIVPCLRGMEHVFWAAAEAPFPTTDKPKGFRYPSGAVLPLATVYRAKHDIGLSAIAPLELRKPGLTVRFDWEAGTLHFRNAHLRLGDPWKATTGLWLVPHQACWRPPLAWLLRRYPDYFESHPRVLAGEGLYEGCWLRGATMNDPEERKSRGVTWVESHSFWPFYGLYIPDRDPWRIIHPKNRRKPEDLIPWEQGKEKGREMSRQWVRNYVAAYHKLGIQYYAYVNTNEAWLPYADKYFADSVAYRHAAPSYGGMAIMNAWETTSWGKHIREQVRRTIECFPKQDGVFLYQNCHRGWHFGTDDGVSMVGGKLACQIGFAQEQMLAFMHRLAAPHRMGIWTNYAGVGVESTRYVHGIMSEAVRPRAQHLQYLCLARPLCICNGDRTARLVEERFKSCLSCGAFPPARWDASTLTRRIVARYLPLNQMLKGRRWVLHARALALPPATEGNIFGVPSGDILVPIISPKASQVLPHPEPLRHDLPVTVRLPDADRIRHAWLLSPDYEGPGELEMARDGESIRVVVPAHLAASVIVFTTRDGHAVARTSSPALARGETNTIAFRIRPQAGLEAKTLPVVLTTPWGTHTAEAKWCADGSFEAVFHVPVPANAPAREAGLSLTAGPGARPVAKQKFTAWVETPASFTCARTVFVKHKTTSLRATALNHTAHPVTIALAVEPAGVLEPPKAFRLGPYERRPITIPASRVERASQVRLQATAHGAPIFHRLVQVRVPRAPRADDILHEPFDPSFPTRWSVRSGQWVFADGEATARGGQHWATLAKPKWTDYGVQLRVKMDGSADPSKPWVKAYLFVRMNPQGTSFARFGFTGQCRTREGYTRVAIDRCVDGQYKGTIADGRLPYREGEWYVMRLEVRGRHARGYVDGKLVVDTALPDDVSAAGGIGIGVQEDSMVNHYRDLIVYPLGHDDPPRAEPVGTWTFDDGLADIAATDQSEREVHGDVSGCRPVAGKVGKAARLDGDNSYIFVKGNPALWTPSFAFAAWVRPETFALKDGHPGPIIFATYNSWRGPALRLSRDEGVPILMLRAGTGKSFDLKAPRPIPLNAWTHLAATYDAAARKACLYVNGTLVSSGTGDSHPGTHHALVLGKWFHCDAAHYTGALDEVHWFARALSAAEVAALCQRK